MSAGGSLARGPSEDGTAVRYGRREVRTSLGVAAGCLAVSAPGLVAAALVDSGLVAWILGVVFALPALEGLLLPFAALGERQHRFVFDAAGWWWLGVGPEQDIFVAWESLGGVCICSTGDASGPPGTATLELFPRGDFDRDDPRLWPFVRDGDPPAEGLPRLRYRIELTRMINFTPDVEEACERWVPADLWHGNVWQPSGYKGRPDRAGHRRRLRKRRQSGGAVPPYAAPPHDGPKDVPLSDTPG